MYCNWLTIVILGEKQESGQNHVQVIRIHLVIQQIFTAYPLPTKDCARCLIHEHLASMSLWGTQPPWASEGLSPWASAHTPTNCVPQRAGLPRDESMWHSFCSSVGLGMKSGTLAGTFHPLGATHRTLGTAMFEFLLFGSLQEKLIFGNSPSNRNNH